MNLGFGKKKINTLVEESDYKKIGTKEFWAITRWIVVFIFKLEPLYSTTFVLSSIVASMSDIVSSYILAKVIDVLIKVSTQGTAQLSVFYPYLAIIVGYGLMNRILNFLGGYSETSLRILLEPKIKKAFYDKLNVLGVQTLEQPALNDRIHRASEYIEEVYQHLRGLVMTATSLVHIVVILVIVIRFFPIFIPVVLLLILPYYFSDRKYRGLTYRLIFEQTSNARMADFSAQDLGTPAKLGETSIIGAYNFLDAKYFNFRLWLHKKRARLQKNRDFFNQLFAFGGDLATYYGIVVVVTQMLQKIITVGDVTFRVGLLSRFQSAITDLIRSVNWQMEQAVKIREVYLLFAAQPDFRDGDLSLPKLVKGPDIIVDRLSFSYPNSERFIFNNLSLNIKSGEKVAIVGHNGAGKTTLVKLLCRIYQPTSGHILVNNQNLRDVKIDSWYKNIGVLFQEFNTYPQLTAKENIIIGNPNEPVDEMAVRLAAQSADALGFIEEFPNKFDQVLSEKFKGGIRPSTGQWQKLAIARFFYRNAPLVIFDEPTASIDAVSEYNIFNRIYDFFKEKTVIIISHRFSTVRNADRIIVLDHGEIIEEGTHDHLMSNNGYYAKAFNLQAKGYSSGENSEEVN